MVIEILNRLEVTPIGKTTWELISDFNISVNERVYTIPKGFITDFASTPRISWVLFPSSEGLYKIPSVLHDWLYTSGEVDREYADKVFYYFMLQKGVNIIKARIIYYSVRLFGSKHYTNRNLYK